MTVWHKSHNYTKGISLDLAGDDNAYVRMFILLAALDFVDCAACGNVWNVYPVAKKELITASRVISAPKIPPN